MAKWVRLCAVQDAPKAGEVIEREAEGVSVCLANANGRLHAVSNVCPHRGAPLAQGWLEGESVVCPLHSWTFDLVTGLAHEPEDARIAVFALLTEGENLLVDIS